MGRKQAPNLRVPKVRSWIRPTKVHTPKPKKEQKHPKKDFETEWNVTKKGYILQDIVYNELVCIDTPQFNPRSQY